MDEVFSDVDTEQTKLIAKIYRVNSQISRIAVKSHMPISESNIYLLNKSQSFHLIYEIKRYRLYCIFLSIVFQRS